MGTTKAQRIADKIADRKKARQREIRTQRRADTQVNNYLANHRETAEEPEGDE